MSRFSRGGGDFLRLRIKYTPRVKKKKFLGEVGGSLTRRATTTFRPDFVYLNNSHSTDIRPSFLVTRLKDWLCD